MSLTDQYAEAQTDRKSDETPKARKSPLSKSLAPSKPRFLSVYAASTFFESEGADFDA